MQSVWSMAKLEVRQQLRSGVFWVVVAFMVLATSGKYGFSASVWANLRWANSSVGFASLPVAFLGLIAAGRERRQRVGELIDATPCPSLSMLLGQWLGLALLAAALAFVPVGIVAIRCLFDGAVSPGATLFYWLTFYLPNLLLPVSFGLAVGYVLPSTFVAFPVTLAWWFLISILSADEPNVLPFIWLQYFDTSVVSAALPTPVFGFLPLSRYILNRIAQVGMSLLLLSITAVTFKRGRDLASTRIVALLLTSLLLCGASMAGLAMDHHAIKQAIAAPLMSLGLSDGPDATVLSHQLDVRLIPGSHGLEATSKLQLRNDSDRPVLSCSFLLNRSLRIQAVTCNEQSAQIRPLTSPDQHELVLDQPLPPGATVNLQLSYSGQVWEWANRWKGGGAALRAFISRQGAYLPPESRWYPEFSMGKDRSVIDFKLSVEGAGPAISNLPLVADNSWAGGAGAVLVSVGEWIRSETDAMVLYAPPGTEVRELGRTMQGMYNQTAKLLGPLTGGETTVLVMPGWYGQTLDVARTRTIVIDETDVAFPGIRQARDMYTKLLDCWLGHATANRELDPEEQAVADQRYAVLSYCWSLIRTGLNGDNLSLQEECDLRREAVELGSLPDYDEPGHLIDREAAGVSRYWLELYQVHQVQGEQALADLLRAWVR